MSAEAVAKCAHTKYAGFDRLTRCKNSGKVEREGKMWCGVHDPEAVKARRDATHARWRAESEANEKRHTLERAAPLLADALEAILHRDPDCSAETHHRIIDQAEAALRAAGRLP